MNVSISVHARSEKVFEPGVKFMASKPEADSFFVLNLDSFYVDIFMTHEQMITLRDVLSAAIENSPFKCGVRECEEARVTNCENCDANFCADHGQKGGDREGGTNPNGSPHGAYAVPSICNSCCERSHA